MYQFIDIFMRGNETVRTLFVSSKPDNTGLLQTLVTFSQKSKVRAFSLVFCVFDVYRPTREIFTHMETSSLPVKDCNARHLWPLSSEGSIACHTYCDTGHPFIMVISEDP